MRRSTQAILFALAFLAAGELLLRSLPEPAAALPADFPAHDESACFLLGTSRTMHGLAPRIVERALRERGAAAWVANVSANGLTMVGTHALYVRQVHPLVRRRSPSGVVAIEVRGSGMNDHYLTADDRAHLHDSAPSAGPDAGSLRALGRGDPDGWARHLLARSALSRLRPRLEAALAATPPRAPGVPDWASGDRGWVPSADPPLPDRGARHIRAKYRARHLRDYRLGGVQTRFLVDLIRLVRSDGLRPVLYVMPISELHRGFYGPGEYAAFRAHLRSVARREGVRLLDLDAAQRLGPDSFQDTHHLTARAAMAFSRDFADAVLWPELAPDPPLRLARP